MEIIIKPFKELTTEELYAVLQLRSEVFVVEQDCVYQDVDGKDFRAMHVLGKKEDMLVAYTRVFKPGDYFEKTAIGRVVVKASERQYGLGKIIMQATIQYIELNFEESTMVLSAQTYLIKFYNSLGFQEVGEEYLEDDIPHIKMIRS